MHSMSDQYNKRTMKGHFQAIKLIFSKITNVLSSLKYTGAMLANIYVAQSYLAQEIITHLRII